MTLLATTFATTVAAIRRSISGGAPLTVQQRASAMDVLVALEFATRRVPRFAAPPVASFCARQSDAAEFCGYRQIYCGVQSMDGKASFHFRGSRAVSLEQLKADSEAGSAEAAEDVFAGIAEVV